MLFKEYGERNSHAETIHVNLSPRMLRESVTSPADQRPDCQAVVEAWVAEDTTTC